MSTKQNDPAAPPFATRDGKPAGQGQTISRPADFLGKPNGSAAPAGGRDFIAESPPQKDGDQKEQTGGYVPPQDRSVRQQPGSPAQRVAPQSIPEGGSGVRDTPSVPRSGAGSLGNQRAPFKVK